MNTGMGRIGLASYLLVFAIPSGQSIDKAYNLNQNNNTGSS